MRGKTLLKKRYGPGIRPGLMREVEAPWPGCAVDVGDHPCTDPVVGKIEMYVDEEAPPTRDWYAKLLRKLPLNTWVWVKLCEGHFRDVTNLSLDANAEADRWAPDAVNPFVLLRPPQLLTAQGAYARLGD